MTLKSIPLEINSYIIPFKLCDGLIVVTGSIDDSIGNFILDTGAEGLVLNNKRIITFISSSKKNVAGLGGQFTAIHTNENNLNVDEMRFFNQDATTIDMSDLEFRKKIKIHGLIGYDLIKDFELMINYREKFLTFSRLNSAGDIIHILPHTSDKVDSLSFKMAKIIPLITIKVNGIEKLMGLDTGAEINLLNSNNSEDIKTFTPIKTISFAGADGNAIEALAGRLYKVKLHDKYRCGGMATVITNLSNLESIYGTKLDGILGFEFLSPWLFSINYKKQMLYIHRLKSIKP